MDDTIGNTYIFNGILAPAGLRGRSRASELVLSDLLPSQEQCRRFCGDDGAGAVGVWGGEKIIVGADVEAAALTRVIKALRR
ncbi:hypothetical protein IYY11_04920 [Methylocystis sp. H62]|jgi:hypothetical protein|uniref:Uncharacterized protein n=1 Tax=Methylocystis rosea TaxID=173366 RepID=A0A3G8MCT3_9HYPH|nr:MULTISPECIES: hypothetical protein [Methylocystis]AZG79055.1 hypothetical protein EHO51_19805 [Methylocystis rosea]MBG0792755.1 hypothetical protein [Methylocystis sp. H62]MBG0797302.1 hypothetical protein [Methylocystis sp. L43]MBG0804673.1 hypothetical protein [Methylocystis sp. H15]QGM95919.1 hypothetical protein F7D13_17710 [Methylocystis rosea]